jgi:acetyl-CoA/propionyl-CoA carboxylase, biotin carboxylase, biotin carboxyl carrier protein
MFEAVLIANRGEIAVRIIRTLRRLEIKSIAVYSDEDRYAKHVQMADHAWRIGAAPPQASYLNIDRILGAAVASGATALHPGYGFLAENPDLARACLDHGVAFIGPPAHAIWTMGDKNRAKSTVSQRGVRVVPGIDGSGLDPESMAERALDLQFPVLIKPAGGGGGKGMRRVDDPQHLSDEIAAAQREAHFAFGNDDLLIEHLIEQPRHIEVQILADSEGNVIHFGERECSLQRRHQKVIEEAPSPLLNDEQRCGIAEQAIEAARACDYINAGTVEFIVAANDPSAPYFMEMNTRLQVEHPVTELVWGVDLVELQIRIAAGQRLPFAQEDLAPTGHAIEARVYAEDPEQGFLPTGGQILQLHEPADLPGVRVDSCLQVGLSIGSTYDPMLSKVIAWSPTRRGAVEKLDSALAEVSILGLTSNVSYLRHLLADERVIQGELDTGLIDRIPPASKQPNHEAAVLAALLGTRLSRGDKEQDLWSSSDSWRIGPSGWALWRALDTYSRVWEVRSRWFDDHLTARVGDATYEISGYRVVGDRLWAEIDGQSWSCTFVRSDAEVWLGCQGFTWHFQTVPLRDTSGSESRAEGSLKSPMPGVVSAIHVRVGDQVIQDDTLVTVEAMKMEHSIIAPFAGTVSALDVEIGTSVELGQTLVTIEAAALEKQH